MSLNIGLLNPGPRSYQVRPLHQKSSDEGDAGKGGPRALLFFGANSGVIRCFLGDQIRPKTKVIFSVFYDCAMSSSATPTAIVYEVATNP